MNVSLLRIRATMILRRILLRHPSLLALVHNPVGRWLRGLIVGSSEFEEAQQSAALPAPSYEDYRLSRIAACETLYSDLREQGLLSFVTTVWNTDVEFLRVLADSLLAQRGGTGFEWFILDNGSADADTIAFLESLRAHDFVRLERVEENLGIVGGMRYCLERATGRYIMPLDSDDYLYPKCVSIYTVAIQRAGYPALLYSDEDKLQGEDFLDAYYKPDWDPVLFVNSCYIAHLCAIDRKIALSLEIYNDPDAEGSHDWDTFMRFMIAGHKPVHISEVLYSWRMHPQSTAGNYRSKPVIYDSHTSVLNKFVAASQTPDHFELVSSPLFGGTPDWWISRRHINPRVLTTLRLVRDEDRASLIEIELPALPGSVEVVLVSEGLEGLMRHLGPLAEANALVHLLGGNVVPQGENWPWEARGMFELFPDCVMVGGRTLSASQQVLAAGQYFGFGDGCSAPDRGRSAIDPGYFAQMWKPHSVSAVSSEHAVVDAAFLRDAVHSLIEARLPATLFHLGAWCGAIARRSGKQVIYSPFVHGLAGDDWSASVNEDEHRAFASYAWDLMPDEVLLSPRLGLDRASAYRPVIDARRQDHLDQLAKRFNLPSRSLGKGHL